MKVKIIKRFTKKTLADVNSLLSEWYGRPYAMKRAPFASFIRQSHLLGLYDEQTMVGMVTVIEMHKVSGRKGSVEHLVLANAYRGRGLGELLMRQAIAFAKKRKLETLFLTCEPERAAAQRLYQKLGFEKKRTDFYYLNFVS